MPVPATTDDAVLSTALEAWLRGSLARPSLRVVELKRPKAGASNETVILTVEWVGEDGADSDERLVCRLQPDRYQLYPRPDAVREGRVLQAVEAASAVPVPHVLAFEPGRELLGSPFFVMNHVDGRVLPQRPSCHVAGWLLDCAPSERATLWDNGLRTLVDIARIPAEGNVGFLWEPALGKTGLEQLIVATRRWFDWAREGRELDVLSRAMVYLEDNRPDFDDAVLTWGDSRPGNMIFDVDGGVAAVLDWEQASIGPAEVDLGWWLMMDEYYSHGLGVPPLPGVPDEAAQIARWEQLIGRPAREVAYFKILATLRLAIIGVRHVNMSIERGVVAPDTTLHTRSLTGRQVYRCLGEPVPDLAPEVSKRSRSR